MNHIYNERMYPSLHCLENLVLFQMKNYQTHYLLLMKMELMPYYMTLDRLMKIHLAWPKKNSIWWHKSTLRKRNSGERNLWWSEWLVVLCDLNEFGDSSGSVFREFVNVVWCTKPYFLIRPNRTMTLLNLVIEPSQWVPIIGSVGTSKIDESQWIHWMIDGDVFCTLYLLNPPKFPKPNVYNCFLSFVFGLKTPSS